MEEEKILKKIMLLLFVIFSITASLIIVSATDEFSSCMENANSSLHSCIDTANSSLIDCIDSCSGNSTCENVCDQEHSNALNSCDTQYSTDENECINENAPSISISSQDNNLGEETTLNVEVDTGMTLEKITIDWGDGNPEETFPLNHIYGNNIEEEYTHEYDEEGTYTIVATVFSDNGLTDQDTENQKIETPEVEDQKPTITLISPSNKQTIKNQRVDFVFRVSDDQKVSSCQYELYNNKGTFKELNYTQNVNNLQENADLKISLEEFEEGNYTWYIICQDDSSQERREGREFTIKLYNHPHEKEIKELLQEIDNFLKEEESFEVEKKEAIEKMGIYKEMIYYQKRLLQINQDLGNNFKYISDETLRTQKEREELNELDQIKSKIITGGEITGGKEYIKNPLPIEMDKIFREYISIKNLELTKRAIKKIVQENEINQKNILVSTRVSQLELETRAGKEEYTLVTKKIDLKEDGKILERIPLKLAQKVTFLSDKTTLEKGFYEITKDDLRDGEIIYYFNGTISNDEIEETNTLLFTENPSKKISKITGYSIVSDLYPLKNPFLLVAIAIILLGGVFLIFNNKKRIGKKYKKMEIPRKISNLTKNAEKLLEEKDYDACKEKYHKIKELYPKTPKEFRKKIYQRISKIKEILNKREMGELVKEFEKAKREGRIEDKKRVYNIIKEKYKTLSEKDQEKIIERVLDQE